MVYELGVNISGTMLGKSQLNFFRTLKIIAQPNAVFLPL